MDINYISMSLLVALFLVLQLVIHLVKLPVVPFVVKQVMTKLVSIKACMHYGIYMYIFCLHINY